MAQTRLTWYGQAGFKIVTPANKVLLIDPWLTNPVFTKGKEELAALKDVDLILLSHGHSDHVGDAVEIGKKTDAKLVATYDLSAAMTTALGYPSNLADSETTGHFGGQLNLLDGDVAVCFVPAWHGSGVCKDDKSPPVYAGNPSGFSHHHSQRADDLSHRRYLLFLRHRSGIGLQQDRYHASLHRRSFHHGTDPRR